MLSWKGGSGSSGLNLGPAQGTPRISPYESEFYKNKVKKHASETLHLCYSVEISLVLLGLNVSQVLRISHPSHSLSSKTFVAKFKADTG